MRPTATCVPLAFHEQFSRHPRPADRPDLELDRGAQEPDQVVENLTIAGTFLLYFYDSFFSAKARQRRQFSIRRRVVRGSMVRSRSVIGNFGASIQALFGGNISLYTSLCERAREDTFNQMLTHAGQLGANAVIGVRYDATEIAPGITEVLCYGTAVFVEKAD